MSEREPKTKPVYVLIKEAVTAGVNEYRLTMTELHELFMRQAEVDNSGDNPVLLSNFKFEVEAEGLYIFTPYTVSDLENPNERVGLIIEGRVKNNEEGVLSDEECVDIYTDKDTRIRVLAAFEQEGDNTFPVSFYIKAMLEDALEGEVVIDKMRLDENNLVLTIRKSS